MSDGTMPELGGWNRFQIEVDAATGPNGREESPAVVRSRPQD